MDIIDDLVSAFGRQDAHPGMRDDDGTYDADGNTYQFICIVKGGNKTFFDGFESMDEARDKVQEVIYESAVDPDGQGVWMVTAVVDTVSREVWYPAYTSSLDSRYPTALDSLT